MVAAELLAPPIGYVLPDWPRIVHRNSDGAIGCTDRPVAGLRPDDVTPIYEIPSDGSLFQCAKRGCWPRATWRCADCGKPVDTAELIRLSQLIEKQKELKALQEELGEHAAA